MSRPDPRLLAAIGAGGALGALARAGLVEAFPVAPDAWPWPTFVVNLLGAAVLAWAVTRLQERLPLSTYRRPFLGTGLCGALTTFSAFQVELLDMIDAGAVLLAAAYAATSIAAGFLVVLGASSVTRRVRSAA